MKAKNIVGALGMLATAHALAADPLNLPGDRWMPWFDNYRYVSCGHTAHGRIDPWTDMLKRLATLVGQAPGATSPQWYAQMEGTVMTCERPFTGQLTYWPWPQEQVVFKGTPDDPGLKRPTHTGETTALTIEINKTDWLDVREGEFGPKEGAEAIGFADVTRTFGGLPVVNDKALLITHSSRPLFLPVSMETALKAYLAHGIPSHRPQAARKLESLSAGERQAPAYLYDNDGYGGWDIVSKPGPHARQLFTLNQDYLDPKLPPQAAQIIAVTVWRYSFGWATDDPRAARERPAREVLEHADWQRIAREIVQ